MICWFPSPQNRCTCGSVCVFPLCVSVRYMRHVSQTTCMIESTLQTLLTVCPFNPPAHFTQAQPRRQIALPIFPCATHRNGRLFLPPARPACMMRDDVSSMRMQHKVKHRVTHTLNCAHTQAHTFTHSDIHTRTRTRTDKNTSAHTSTYLLGRGFR